jgi:2'-5' RNA ligase
MPMSDTLRTFVAFTLPKDIAATLETVKASLVAYGFKVRWVSLENIHLTLKFLGDIKKKDIDPIAHALRETVAGRDPISFRVSGLGMFPGMHRPRVIWVGLTGEIDRIVDCQQVLDTHLSAVGFPREKRPFKGHITLGRVKGRIRPDRLLEALTTCSAYESIPVIVDRMHLIQSDLKPAGASYTALRTAPFTEN